MQIANKFIDTPKLTRAEGYDVNESTYLVTLFTFLSVRAVSQKKDTMLVNVLLTYNFDCG